ncbi:MAG: hydroxysqualene dehydroxylase HpnE [Planctomycetota bacterium]
MNSLDESYAACKRIAEASGSNFVRSFQFLGLERRRAMNALYAFARLADDAIDGDGSSEFPNPKTWDAPAWIALLKHYDAPESGLNASPSVPTPLAKIWPALSDSIRRFSIPVESLVELVRGVDMDANPLELQTWDDLKTYAYRVASTVGIGCAAIWSPEGPLEPDSKEWHAAVDCGIAFQMTNILRDVSEDARNNRLYLPLSELAFYGIQRREWIDTVSNPNPTRLNQLGDWRGLLRVQFERADALFERGWGVTSRLAPDGLRMFSLMWNTYRSLFEQIRKDPNLIFQQRIRVALRDKWKLAFNHVFTPRFHRSLHRRESLFARLPGSMMIEKRNDALSAESKESRSSTERNRMEGRVAHIAVIGGGLAGIQAAMHLARHGCNVSLIEAKSRLGGRAGSFVDSVSGAQIDYCQHVGMNCCHALKQWIRETGQAEHWRTEQKLHFVSKTGTKMTASGWPLPPPSHLAGLLLRWPGIHWIDRIQIGKALWSLIRTTPSADFDVLSARQWLTDQGQSHRAIECFWTTILVSALGEQLDRVTMGPVRKVLIDGFAATRDAYHLLVPEAPLSTLINERSHETLSQLGVDIQCATTVSKLVPIDGNRWSVQVADHQSRIAPTERSYDAVVVAVPWYRFASLWNHAQMQETDLDSSIGRIAQHASRMDSAPITGIHTWWDRPWLKQEHAILIDRLCQWIFPGPSSDEASVGVSRRNDDGSSSNRETYYQIVISGSRDLPKGDPSAILREVKKDLSEVFPEAAIATLLRGKVVTDPYSVFSVSAGQEASRPSPDALANHGIMIAGDWTKTGWPATMEGALRSGSLAAEAALDYLGRPATLLQDR